LGNTYNIGRLAVDGENKGCSASRAEDCANGPEKCQAVKHLAEILAGLVPEVQTLTKLGTTRSVDGADILNVCVDAGAKRRALRQRRDAAGGRHLIGSHDV
jgi:hypothetical protein